MKPKSAEASSSKRRYSSHEESASSNDESKGKAHVSKKPIEKKVKERTSPPTTDDECQRTKSKEISVWSEEIDRIVTDTDSVSLKSGGKDVSEKTGKQSSPKQDIRNVEIRIEESNKEHEEKDTSDPTKQKDKNVAGSSSLKDDIKEIEQLWSTIERKRNVSVGTKGPRDAFKYDYLGEEVDDEEAEALEALSFYWLNTVAKKAATPRTDIPEEHKEFYDKYCNGTRELTVESAMKLMMLPHVVTVNLKSNAKIEVVVSDVFLALQDSPELRNEDFECVEAMGMHLF